MSVPVKKQIQKLEAKLKELGVSDTAITKLRKTTDSVPKKKMAKAYIALLKNAVANVKTFNEAEPVVEKTPKAKAEPKSKAPVTEVAPDGVSILGKGGKLLQRPTVYNVVKSHASGEVVDAEKVKSLLNEKCLPKYAKQFTDAKIRMHLSDLALKEDGRLRRESRGRFIAA